MKKALILMTLLSFNTPAFGSVESECLEQIENLGRLEDCHEELQPTLMKAILPTTKQINDITDQQSFEGIQAAIAFGSAKAYMWTAITAMTEACPAVTESIGYVSVKLAKYAIEKACKEKQAALDNLAKSTSSK